MHYATHPSAIVTHGDEISIHKYDFGDVICGDVDIEILSHEFRRASTATTTSCKNFTIGLRHELRAGKTLAFVQMVRAYDDAFVRVILPNESTTKTVTTKVTCHFEDRDNYKNDVYYISFDATIPSVTADDQTMCGWSSVVLTQGWERTSLAFTLHDDA